MWGIKFIVLMMRKMQINQNSVDHASHKSPIKRRKIIHYRKNCIGCGMCAYISPKYWEISELDGLASLKDSERIKDVFMREIDVGDEKECFESEKACPVNIIKLS